MEKAENIEDKKQEIAETAENTEAQASQEQHTDQAAHQEETQEDINWKKFREERAREREEAKRREELLLKKEEEARALQEALKAAMENKGSSLTQAEQEQIIADLEDNDIPMGKDIKQFLARYVPDTVEDILAKREQKRREQEQEKAQSEMPKRLRENIPDFDSVMTQENVDYLEYHHPEVADLITKMPSGYDKWSNAYKLVKKLVPNADRPINDHKRANENLAKPQVAAAGNSGHSAEPSPGRRLTQAEKDANYRRMMELARSI